MSTIHARVHAHLSRTSLESASAESRSGQVQLKKQSQQRRDLRDRIEKNQDRSIDLRAEMEAINDRSWLEGAAAWVLGDDSAGEVQERQLENQAHLEADQAELGVLRQDEKEIFRDMQEADQSVQATFGALDEILADQDALTELEG